MKRPTLLLLPGLLCDETVWTHQAEILSRHAACVIPDFGMLDDINEMASAAIASVPEGPLMVAGHSMGGRVALEIVRRFPTRVDRLALLDTGTDPLATGTHGENERARRMELLETARRRGMRSMGEAWARGMVHPSRLDSLVFEAILAMIQRSTPAQFEAQLKALLNRPDARDTFANLKCPTLLVCGRQDTWSPLARHEKMQRALPHAQLEVIENSGHMTLMEQPEAVAEILLKWM